jgi:hypothetical protein
MFLGVESAWPEKNVSRKGAEIAKKKNREGHIPQARVRHRIDQRDSAFGSPPACRRFESFVSSAFIVAQANSSASQKINRRHQKVKV